MTTFDRFLLRAIMMLAIPVVLLYCLGAIQYLINYGSRIQ
jgi:hypothetical protein